MLPSRARAAALLGVVFLLTSGCEIIANFDRSLIDAGSDLDAEAVDANYPTGDDGAQPEASAPEAGQPETGATPDAGVDTGVDSSVADTGTDAHVADVGTDTNAPDTSAADTGADTSVPDATGDDGASDAADASTE